jgi:hypothetical protein
MNPVISDYEFQVLDRRRRELIAGVERDRFITACLADTPSAGSTHGWSRSAIHKLAGWLAPVRAADRGTLPLRPETTNTSVQRAH